MHLQFRPRLGKSSIAAIAFPDTAVSRVRQYISWPALGAALLGAMLARWTWLLFAPAGAAMPPPVWEASEHSGHLFGTARESTAPAALASSNIRLIGVFSHQSKGFAVMEIDGKQVGVALGHEVRPGVRLAETHHDYVVLEQGGVRSRVDLAGVVSPADASQSAATDSTPLRSPADEAREAEALQHQLDAAGSTLSPQQREVLQRQIENLRRGR